MTRVAPGARAPLAALGVAIGLGAELAHVPPLLLALAFGVSAALLALGAGLPARDDDPAPLPPAARPPRSAPLLALAGSALSALLVVVALRRFAAAPTRGAWLLWIAAVAVLLAGFSSFSGTREGRPRPSRGELAWLLAILAVACAFRFHLLGTEPYGVWFDEAQNAIEAKKILDSPAYRPVFVSGISQMPALSFYYFALFVKLVGPRVLAVRLGTTLVGLLAIVFVWLLGRELFGPEPGLLGAGFLAVSRWHVDFSRFGMAIVFPTLFVPAALYFFARALRRRSPRAAAVGGVVLGLGMQTYYAMLAVPLLVILAAAHGFATRRALRALATPALTALLLASAYLAYAPVLQYARAHELEFSERMRTVSAVQAGSTGELARILLTPSPRRAEALDVLARNTAAHAAMFHVAGDRNGRHNLPGAPMLDPVTGVFFAVGLLFALALLLDWRMATLLLWFGAMIAAGILSLDFEAPQGARTCGLNSVIALLAALPLARLGTLVAGTASRAALLALPVAAAGVLSWRTYFGPQLHDPKVFREFSAVETRMAEVAKAEGEGAALYAPLVRIDMPVEMLTLGRRLRATVFQRAQHVPLETNGRRAIVFLEPSELDTVAELRRLYPHATVERLAPTLEDGSKGEPIFFVVRVPAADVAALSGLEIRYEGEGGRAMERQLSAVLDWTRAPVSPPFTAEARGTLHVVAHGEYAFRVAGDVPARLEIDGELAADGGAGRRMTLARGSHALRVWARVGSSGRETRVLWSGIVGAEAPIEAARLFGPAVRAAGLLGRYHRGSTCADPLAYAQIDPQILFSFYGLGPSRPFAVCWSGSLFAPESGTYLIGTSSHPGSTVAIDDRPVVRNPADVDFVDEQIALDAGWHAIDVSYVGREGFPHIELRWRRPGGQIEYVPSARLAPPAPSGLRRRRDAPPPE